MRGLCVCVRVCVCVCVVCVCYTLTFTQAKQVWLEQSRSEQPKEEEATTRIGPEKSSQYS